MNSLEVEYNEVLHWKVPGPMEPGESSRVPGTQWEEGIQLVGVIQPLRGNQTLSLMANSYGFQFQEGLLRVQKYL